MARLEERDETYFSTVRGMCRHCRQIVPARVFFRSEQVWQQSLCPSCTNTPALIASDKDWYLGNVLKPMPDRAPLPGARPCRNGCPHDCGPCAWHASPCQLPVICITNACNLRCPICFTYNRAEHIYYLPVDEMRRTVDGIIESSGPVDLINITGGEPTLHPELSGILRTCRRPQIGRVTMNSNGIRLAEDFSLCEQLANLGVYVILSFNTLDREASRLLHGRDITDEKLQAIDNLTRAGVRLTLLNVMIRGLNEHAAADLFRLMRRSDTILSLMVQPMTYAGQGRGTFDRTGHLPVDEAARIVCGQSDELLDFHDFVTRRSAHPLCYLICYMLKSDDTLLPLARLTNRENIAALLEDSYLPRPDAEDGLIKRIIEEQYAQGRTDHLTLLHNLVHRLHPQVSSLNAFDRHRIAESVIRTVSVHAHMDEDTFDCSRAMLCPDLVASEPGRLIPACTYNLFYRTQEERLYAE